MVGMFEVFVVYFFLYVFIKVLELQYVYLFFKYV